VKQLYAGSTDPKDAGLSAWTWDYPTEGKEQEPSADAVLKEMNGYTWTERRQIESFQQLNDDGTTACGGWLYCGVYPKDRDNRARARRPTVRTVRARIWAGLGLARQPAQYVQSRLGGRTGPPWSERKRADVMGHRPR